MSRSRRSVVISRKRREIQRRPDGSRADLRRALGHAHRSDRIRPRHRSAGADAAHDAPARAALRDARRRARVGRNGRRRHARRGWRAGARAAVPLRQAGAARDGRAHGVAVRGAGPARGRRAPVRAGGPAEAADRDRRHRDAERVRDGPLAPRLDRVRHDGPAAPARAARARGRRRARARPRPAPRRAHHDRRELLREHRRARAPVRPVPRGWPRPRRRPAGVHRRHAGIGGRVSALLRADARALAPPGVRRRPRRGRPDGPAQRSVVGAHEDPARHARRARPRPPGRGRDERVLHRPGEREGVAADACLHASADRAADRGARTHRGRDARRLGAEHVSPVARRRLRPRYRRLFWRIFAANAVVLAGASVMAVLILSPGSLSEPVALRELAILALALVVMVLANLVVTQRLVAPLEQLVRVMREVDLLKPGSRVSVGGAPSEATELAETFNAMLDRLESEREESMRRVIGAQEAERLRIAQELHDEIGQNLTAALLQLARVRKRAGPELEEEVGAARGRKRGAPELGEEVGAAAETVRANLDDLRRTAQRLRPQALDELGLTSALSQFSARLSARAGLEIDARLDSELPALTREEELVIYRVAQEALTNVVRHAGATRTQLTLERAPDRLTLRVADDGRCFEGTSERNGGMRGMHERAALIHADLRIGRREGGGTEIVLNVPLTEDGLWYR